MTECDAFLREIGAHPEDDNLRLIFSDWLEENGDPECAEFIRIQCELRASELSEEYRHSLRVRERALLDAHRHEWRQALGLPIEEISFERGLVARIRLSEWQNGLVLDSRRAAWLTPLAELDLSGLQIGDAGLSAFAERTQLPALSKLILSDNGITNGDQIAAAMDEGRWLAADVAHLDIQMHHGILAKTVLNRLMSYERIAEVHVSTSNEHRDTHAKLSTSTWGIEWARAHLVAGTPVILECYMHKLSHEERLEQIAFMLESTPGNTDLHAQSP